MAINPITGKPDNHRVVKYTKLHELPDKFVYSLANINSFTKGNVVYAACPTTGRIEEIDITGKPKISLDLDFKYVPYINEYGHKAKMYYSDYNIEENSYNDHRVFTREHIARDYLRYVEKLKMTKIREKKEKKKEKDLSKYTIQSS